MEETKMSNESQSLLFEGSEVRLVLQGDKPWFVACDVCRVLGVGNPSAATSRLDEDEKMTIRVSDSHSGRRGGAQYMTVVDEAGLYKLTFGSRKEKAKAFTRWVTHDVMPTIRNHGMYATDELLDNPDLIIEAMERIKEQRRKNQQP